MLADVLEFVADVAIVIWPTGKKGWWSLAAFLAVAITVAVVILVTMGD